MKEKHLDYYIAEKLKEANIKYTPQGSSVTEISKALSTASKSKTGNVGFPEFVAVSNGFVIVIEDKKDTTYHINCNKDGTICDDIKSIKDYAVNGAIHYAKHIIENTSFKKVFAIGASGDEKHHKIQPVFISESKMEILDNIDTFENFSEGNIEKYYKVEVLKETPPEEIELAEIIKIAKKLHEDLRNYGQLSEQEKPLVVSAILLALEDENFILESLKGNKTSTDGTKIYTALSNYLIQEAVAPEDKKQAILNQFSFIQSRVLLNEINAKLKKTPLAYFTEQINSKVKKAINISKEDILGRFYGEFVKYSGGDGKGLGIVLTPRHITELFCELLELKPSDIVFDPCCGTAGYLISAMHYMLRNVTDKAAIQKIMTTQLHGIEIRDDLFAIATTNMILRGDGKSNLRLADFIKEDTSNIQSINATVGMMNPPYSQDKGSDNSHLSEIYFITKLLEGLKNDGNSRCAVIVPQSVMVGKNEIAKKFKEQLLKKHTLIAVITLNKETFYRVGTNPCIAIFKAYVPHDIERKVKFINFEDDGYEVKKHVGLVATPRALDRKKALLDAYFDKSDPASNFMVKSTIEASDEWLHSFYYFNDEIPKEEDFMNTMADYLTFEFKMISHGRSYLFEEPQNGSKDEK